MIDDTKLALEVAIDALEKAHAAYLHAVRAHIGDLMAIGLPADLAAHGLRPFDQIERDQDLLVQQLKERLA